MGNIQFSEYHDLDDDGDPDLLLSSKTGKNGIVWFENEDGLFERFHIIETQTEGFNSLIFFDINGDSHNDILFSSEIENTIGWYENEGEGNFGIRHILTESAAAVKELDTLDVDLDGDIDIAMVAYEGDKVAWFENLGGGIFSAENILSVTSNGANGICSADVDSDGDKDIMVCSWVDHSVRWFENYGDGTFSSDVLLTISAEHPNDICTIDLEEDGDLDILVSSYEGEEIIKFENLGDGVFGPKATFYGTYNASSGVRGADVNQDGKIDVCITSFLNNNFTWFENLGMGIYGEPVEITDIQVSNFSRFDIDDNGYMDLLICGAFKVEIHKALMPGVFDTPDPVEVNHITGQVSSLEFIDIDNDGDDDLIFSAVAMESVFWLENYGDHTFGPRRVLIDELDAPSNLTVLDVDGDLINDIIVSDQADHSIAWYKNLTDSTVGDRNEISDFYEGPVYLNHADINGDGDLDIYALCLDDEVISWYENLGGVGFGLAQEIGADDNNPVSVTEGDFNNDGIVDFVACSKILDDVFYYENEGDGDFSDLVMIDDEANEPNIVTVLDVNNDGFVDLIVSQLGMNRIVWYENLEGEGFGSPTVITSDVDGVNYIDIQDVNNDGNQDIIVSSGENDRIIWCANLGDGGFAEPNTISEVEDNPGILLVNDFDADGDLDMISSSKFSPTLAFYGNGFYHATQVKGRLFVDVNENGLNDSLDIGFPEMSISSLPVSDYTFTSSNGNYFMNFSDTSGVYSLGVEDLIYWSITTDSMNYSVVIDSTFINMDSLDFGFYPDTLVDTLAADLTGSFPRCNTVINYWLNVENKGTTIPSGKIHLKLDDNIDYVDTEVEPDSIVGQNIYWSYDSLIYFSDLNIRVEVVLPTFELMGEELISILNVSIDSLGDEVYTMTDTLMQELVCAYDPNDKIADPKGVDSLGFVDASLDQIDYTIRFQNTGTDTAINVLIKDQLDDHLDWGSLDIIASSHEMTTNVDHTGEASFLFEHIMLPDSNVNETASHGFVKYRIHLDEDLPVGTHIYNTAEIYFDANPPVITNKKTHTLYSCKGLLDSLEATAESCENEIWSADIPISPSDINYYWSISDLMESDSSNLIWFADTSGTFVVDLLVSSDFCSADTSFYLTVHPFEAIELPTLQICSTDSTLIFENYQSTEGFYYDTLSTIYGCDSIVSQELVVYDLPIVNFEALADETVCLEVGPIELMASPSEGNFFGTGVSGAFFDPIIAGEGEHWLFYNFDDGNGCSAIDSVQISVIDCLNLKEIDLNKIQIYPNPFDDFTTIYFGRQLTVPHTVTIYNLLGKEVYQQENVTGTQCIIDSGNLKAGTYMLSVLSPSSGEVFTAKIMIN